MPRKPVEANGAGQTSLGRPDFVGRFGLDSPERREAVQAVAARISEAGIEVVRIGFVDTHGQVRSRAIEARHFAQAARNGMPFTTALLAMDSANIIFQPVFSRGGGFGIDAMGGAGDMLAVVDPETFRILPWARRIVKTA